MNAGGWLRAADLSVRSGGALRYACRSLIALCRALKAFCPDAKASEAEVRP